MFFEISASVTSVDTSELVLILTFLVELLGLPEPSDPPDPPALLPLLLPPLLPLLLVAPGKYPISFPSPETSLTPRILLTRPFS